LANPIHHENGKWYFWTETWADREGPFGSQREAEDAMWKYCKTVLRSKDDRIGKTTLDLSKVARR